MNDDEFMIALHFEGKLVKDDETLTARTLGHSLQFLQRMIDKTVLFEKRGTIKKRDTLPAAWYGEADVIVKPFKKGCVIVPLFFTHKTSVIAKLKGLLHDPYEEALSEEPIEKKSLLQGFSAAYNRASYKIDMLTHEQIIQDSASRDLRYFAEGVLKDFDNLISPLRSSAMTDKESISLELKDSKGTKEFEFDRYSSKRFHQIVSATQLGPTVLYSGRLVEFGETKSKDFPYSGRFFSKASKQEHKILISKESDADSLRRYNTAKKLELNFIGAPIMAWGTFDENRGDIVFLKLIDN